MSNINETIEEVEKLNPELARQIRHFVKNHTYGLVFEHNLPEAVRLYNKTPVVKDIVNILPARGTAEKEENKVPWVVKSIKDGKALLEHCEEQKEVPLEDIVTVVSYKDTIYPGLKEIDRVERGDKDDPYHMVINAENYHALEALCYCYAGKVDCIYIDPPYNTSAKDWKYNNDYVSPDDKYKHSKWLAFMERRLKIAKQLLSSNGSLICAIDENELFTLGLLLKSIFPEYIVDCITVIHNPGGEQNTNFSYCHEYAFFVYPNRSSYITDEKREGVESSPFRDWGKENSKRLGSPNCFYPIIVDIKKNKVIATGEVPEADFHPKSANEKIEDRMYVWPIDANNIERRWRFAFNTVTSILHELEPVNINGVVNIKRKKELFTRKTVWNNPSYSSNNSGSQLVAKIIGNRFPFPKSLFLIRECLKAVEQNTNAIIVDFFAGSGTTLHAVNLLNAEDGGRRRCICVTNNEVSEDEEKKFIKAGLRPYDDEWKKYGIAHYVTWPRTKCTIEGHDINGNPLTGNYGCDKEIYEEIEADIIDPETNKKIRGKVYKKSKKPTYPLLAQINKSDGFKANAIFCELTYESAWPIRLDRAFNAIAPMLWMQAGCRGEIINKIGKSFSTTDYYGVLFDYNQASKFCEKVQATPSIKHVYIVTDDQRRYSNLCRRLPGVEVHRLYETYLKTFEICGEGGLD